MPYLVAQTDNTTDFLVELQSRYPDAKLTIGWDNARWHQGAEMERFLAQVNIATKFQEVVDVFERVLERQVFDFPNRQRYGDLQMTYDCYSTISQALFYTDVGGHLGLRL